MHLTVIYLYSFLAIKMAGLEYQQSKAALYVLVLF